MKKLLAMLLAMVMVFSLAACAQGGTTNGVSATEKTAAPDNNGEKDSSTSTGDSDSIDVGVCLTITGSGAPNGLIMLAGVQEYVDMVNEKGGVNGKQIKLHIQEPSGKGRSVGNHWSSRLRLHFCRAADH